MARSVIPSRRILRNSSVARIRAPSAFPRARAPAPALRVSVPSRSKRRARMRGLSTTPARARWVGPRAARAPQPEYSRRMRLFFCVPLPQEAKDAALRALTAARRAAGEGGLSWTKPEQMHLTLAFLGEQPSEALGRLY